MLAKCSHTLPSNCRVLQSVCGALFNFWIRVRWFQYGSKRYFDLPKFMKYKLKEHYHEWSKSVLVNLLSSREVRLKNDTKLYKRSTMKVSRKMHFSQSLNFIGWWLIVLHAFVFVMLNNAYCPKVYVSMLILW